jgi:hypothetical protein
VPGPELSAFHSHRFAEQTLLSLGGLILLQGPSPWMFAAPSWEGRLPQSLPARTQEGRLSVVRVMPVRCWEACLLTPPPPGAGPGRGGAPGGAEAPFPAPAEVPPQLRLSLPGYAAPPRTTGSSRARIACAPPKEPLAQGEGSARKAVVALRPPTLTWRSGGWQEVMEPLETLLQRSPPFPTFLDTPGHAKSIPVSRSDACVLG